MTAARYPADSHEGRILLALRAGTLETTAFYERFASPKYVRTLVKKGLVEQTSDGSYRLTPAGRAACPWRNPLAAPGARPTLNDKPLGKEPAMYADRSKVTRSDVFDAICAAGPAGITRKALADKLGVQDDNISAHATLLCREPGAVVQRPKRGLFVASRYLDGSIPDRQHKPAAPPVTPVPAVPVFAESKPGPIVAPHPANAAAPRYAVAFPSDFSATVEEAVAHALGNYEWASLKDAVVVSCTPLGSIVAGFVPYTGDRP